MSNAQEAILSVTMLVGCMVLFFSMLAALGTVTTPKFEYSSSREVFRAILTAFLAGAVVVLACAYTIAGQEDRKEAICGKAEKL